MTKNWLGWFALYAIVIATVTWLLWQARQDAMETLATDQAQSNWREWQGEAVRQSQGEGPVSRREPHSDEPPELVLLRDYFFTSLVGLVLLTTALFITMMAMIRGVVGGRQFTVVTDADPSAQVGNESDH